MGHAASSDGRSASSPVTLKIIAWAGPLNSLNSLNAKVNVLAAAISWAKFLPLQACAWMEEDVEIAVLVPSIGEDLTKIERVGNHTASRDEVVSAHIKSEETGGCPKFSWNLK